MTGTTWYSLQGSRLAEFWTLLHLPYTLMAICFVLVGLSLNKPINWTVALVLCVAYFLGLGITAHCLDQIPGMGTVYVKYLREGELILIGLTALTWAIAIGLWLIVFQGIWILLPFMIVQTFFAFAYPMARLFNGYFHTDSWFAVGFGMVPFLTGYAVGFSTAGTPLTFLTGFIIPGQVAVICFWVSGMEILMSRFVRRERALSPIIHKSDQGWQRVETALKLLCLTVYFSTIVLLLL
jgi:hypothetical protein